MLEKRGLTVSLSLGLLVGLTAAALAWRESPAPREPPRPMLITKKVVPPAGSAAPRVPMPNSVVVPVGPELPTSLIQPDRARLKDGKLIQDLGKRGVLVYSLVPELQRVATETLRDGEVPFGAVVAIEPKTGRVLVYAQHSEEQPGLARIPLMANPPAASIFKLVTAAALLEQSEVTPETRVCYHGGHRGLTAASLVDDPAKDTKCETMSEALGRSTNQVFGKLAQAYLDPKVLTQYAAAFRFNQTLPFELPVELSQATFGGEPLEFARTAAGFYNTHLSPLHGALVAAAIANEGVMMTPHVVDRLRLGEENGYVATPVPIGRVIKDTTARVLGNMMLTTTTVGTSGPYFRNRDEVMEGVDVAGKTGSLSADQDDGTRLSFSWWVGFAPLEKPEIAVAVLVVNREAWKIKSSLVAREVLEAHFGAKYVKPQRRRR